MSVTVTYKQDDDVLQAVDVSHALLVVPGAAGGYLVRTSATRHEAVALALVVLDMIESQGLLDELTAAMVLNRMDGGSKIKVL